MFFVGLGKGLLGCVGDGGFESDVPPIHVVLLIDVLSLREWAIIVLLPSVLFLFRCLVLLLVGRLLLQWSLGVDETFFDVFFEHVFRHLQYSLIISITWI